MHVSYRSDLDALHARSLALETELALKTKERDAAWLLYEEAKHHVNLPVLQNIRVASPCTASWNDMAGDDRVRECATCNKHVYNLSHMTRDQAERLIVATDGALCVRYYQRADGTILLRDCTIGARRRRRARLVAGGAAALIAASSFVGLRSSHDQRPPEVEQHEPDGNYMIGELKREGASPPTLEQTRAELYRVVRELEELEHSGP
jgi:hypothetical protein